MEFDKAVAELDALVQTLEREGDERALLLLELVDAIHRPALELIARGETEHPIARALLSMYDLVPVDERILVEEALDEVRPYIESHGGSVELLDVEEDVVRVRMSGACVGCAASAMTLKRGIEEAIRGRWPEVRKVVSEEEGGAQPQLLQIENARKPVFVDAGEAGGFAPGQIRGFRADGVDVLLANFDGEVYALRDGCPVDGGSLAGGRMTAEGVLVCPWHNCAFDVRTGARVDGEGDEGLTVVPVALRNGSIQVAVNVA
jgi:Fe-S cluster biogenesis protein NfuA/nitrite reductase/ring-hydroxylating ferredoxin subunit